jgi:hypothetical protein
MRALLVSYGRRMIVAGADSSINEDGRRRGAECSISRFEPRARSSMLGGVEERMEPGAGIIFAADGAAAVSGGFNAAWLFRIGAASPPGRRTAAVALAVLNAGVAVQATAAQALFTTRRLGLDDALFFEPGPWLASRLLLLTGTVLISMLILRRSA